MFRNEEVFSSSLAHGAVGSVGYSSPLGVALHSGTARFFCFSAIPLHDVGSWVGLGWVKASSGPPGPRISPFPARHNWSGGFTVVRSQGLPD